MTSASRSLFVFGIYVVAAGSGLLGAPELVLRLLGFPPTAEGWVRVVGALALAVGLYHIAMSRQQVLPFIRSTVWVRLVFAALLGMLVAMGQMPTPTLLFAAVDVAGALWTGLALRT